MNKNKKVGKNNPILALAVTFGVILLSNVMGTDNEALVPVIIAAALLIYAVFSIIKKAAKKKNDENTAPVPHASSPAALCDYGDYNCDYSHDYESRMKQLDDWLRFGIIDKAEYKVLADKYRRNFEEHNGK